MGVSAEPCSVGRNATRCLLGFFALYSVRGAVGWVLWMCFVWALSAVPSPLLFCELLNHTTRSWALKAFPAWICFLCFMGHAELLITHHLKHSTKHASLGTCLLLVSCWADHFDYHPFINWEAIANLRVTLQALGVTSLICFCSRLYAAASAQTQPWASEGALSATRRAGRLSLKETLFVGCLETKSGSRSCPVSVWAAQVHLGGNKAWVASGQRCSSPATGLRIAYISYPAVFTSGWIPVGFCCSSCCGLTCSVRFLYCIAPIDCRAQGNTCLTFSSLRWGFACFGLASFFMQDSLI